MLDKFAFLCLIAGMLCVFGSENKTAHAAELCPEAQAGVAKPAFERFWDERGKALELQIQAGVCAGARSPVSLPPEAEIMDWIGHTGNLPEAVEAELFSCFGRMFIAKVIEIRGEMEACMGEPDCAATLCPDLETGKPSSEASSNPARNGLSGNMADIYDQNAKDLMAIP